MDFFRQIWHHLLWLVDRNIYRIITIQYLATCALVYFPEYLLKDYYLAISNFLGYSILSNLLIAPKIWKESHRFCEVIKSMLFSLLVSNTFSILSVWTTHEFYVSQFDKYFLISLTTLVYMYYFKKKKLHVKFYNYFKK